MTHFLKCLFLLFLVSCANQDKPSYNEILAQGSLNDTKYFNSYFEVSVIIPRNWLVLNKEEIEERKRIGSELISKSMDISDTTKNREPKFLININKYRRDAQEALQGNAGFQISFLKKEYLKDQTEISFITNARKILESVPNYKNISEINKTKIGGKDFQTFNSEGHFQGYVVNQQSYVLDLNECFLLIDVSFRGDFVKPELERIIQSIKFL